MTESLLLYFIDRLAKQKKLQGIQDVYTAKDKKKEKQKTLPSPRLEATHSKKPTGEESSSPMYKLFQLHKLDTKE